MMCIIARLKLTQHTACIPSRGPQCNPKEPGLLRFFLEILLRPSGHHMYGIPGTAHRHQFYEKHRALQPIWSWQTTI